MIILIPLFILTVTLVTGRWSFFFWELTAQFYKSDNNFHRFFLITTVDKTLCKECLYKAFFHIYLPNGVFIKKLLTFKLDKHILLYRESLLIENYLSNLRARIYVCSQTVYNEIKNLLIHYWKSTHNNIFILI